MVCDQCVAHVAEWGRMAVVLSDREGIVANSANKAPQDLGYASLKPEQLPIVAGVLFRCNATYRLWKDFRLHLTKCTLAATRPLRYVCLVYKT